MQGNIFVLLFIKVLTAKCDGKDIRVNAVHSRATFATSLVLAVWPHQLLNACSYPVPSLHIEPQTVPLLQYSSKTQLNSSANLRSYQKS